MEITMWCWVSFGKLDGNDWEADFEVTEEEYQRLSAVAGQYREFEDAEEVKDIYERLYSELIKEATEQLLDEDPDIADEYGEIDGWEADELYRYGIRFTESFCEKHCIDADNE